MWDGKNFNKKENIFTNILHKSGVEFQIAEKPDFLFYSCYGTEHLKYSDCVKIFFAAEAVTPDFNVCDYAIGFDPIQMEGRYCKRPIWLFNDMPNAISDEDALNRKFCNFVYSNDSLGTAVEFRKKFAKRLMEYKQIDCPGRVLNNMTDAIVPRNGNWRQGKWDFIRNYKFTIAFENCKFAGYTTEKMIDPLSVKSIPIYWGNPIVADELNDSAFVNCKGLELDFDKNIDKVIDRLVELDQNEEKYLKMLHQEAITKEMIDEQREKFEHFILNIIQCGNHPFEKDPLLFYQRMTYPDLSRRQLLKMLFQRKR